MCWLCRVVTNCFCLFRLSKKQKKKRRQQRSSQALNDVDGVVNDMEGVQITEEVVEEKATNGYG